MTMDAAERLRRNAERRRVKHEAITCVRCDTAFIPTRSDALFCSNRCRQGHHRLQRRIAALDRRDAVLEAEGVARLPRPRSSLLDLVASYADNLARDEMAVTPKAIAAAVNADLPGWLSQRDAKVALAWLKAERR
jgi:hypothetical protein